jgi:adenosylmethionine-8-amino-7-oxononanoate aminotransferase
MRRYIAETDPLVVARAEGPRLFDVDGRAYLDANSSWWVAALGHCHPRIVAALRDQAGVLAHASLAGVTHELAANLAAALASHAPRGLERVFFSDDGSTALEVALKMVLGFHRAHGAPERTRFVSLRGAFHGETLGVTALGGVELFRQAFASVLMDVWFIPVPAEDEAEDGPAALAARELFERHGAEIAGVVIEPMVQGATGMRIYPAWFVRLLRELSSAHGALLVDDEVFTGYGRTGPFWATAHAGVVPDIVATAKGLSGGMFPMAATLANEAVFEAFLEPHGALYYGHSYCGNPLGARVALEVLDVYRDEGVLEGIPARAAKIADAFTALARTRGTLRPRALGMIGAIDLSPDASYQGDLGWRVYAEARRRGAYLRPLGDVVYVAPPMNIPILDLEELLAIVAASVRAVLEA